VSLLLLLLLQINDRYEFYDELDLDKDDGKYLSPQVRQASDNSLKLVDKLLLFGLIWHRLIGNAPEYRLWQFSNQSTGVQVLCLISLHHMLAG
jgi:hypothetical protein